MIDPLKDVDGFSSTNIARLYSGDETGLVPGTPKGIMKIIFNYFQGQNTKDKGQNGGNISHPLFFGKSQGEASLE